MSIKDILNKSWQAIAIRDYETAEKLVLNLINLDPDISGSYLLLGNIYTKTGQNKKAIYNFQKSIELNSDNPEAYNNIAVIFRKTGNLSSSLSAIKKAYSIDPERPDIC